MQGTTQARSSEPPDSLQTAMDLLEPQAQAFRQRCGQLPGAPRAVACLQVHTLLQSGVKGTLSGSDSAGVFAAGMRTM